MNDHDLLTKFFKISEPPYRRATVAALGSIFKIGLCIR
jgi:hypothetical protein